MNITHIVGIDEAGRGSLAGPVCVGVVAVPVEKEEDVRTMFKRLKGRDSKRWSESKREKWFEKIRDTKCRNMLVYGSALVGSSMVDESGIVTSINTALGRALRKMGLDPSCCDVRLDGGLFAPRTYLYQETIVKGDERDIIIGMASIVAKVTRDRKMRRLARLYPMYAFDTHKGYGTEKHYGAIGKNGLCPEHRRTFLVGR
ncbi:MAG: ribonuclease HII [Parcubacteria group bacterium]|nr:ribonuclease HII [Parcubacteria group bacterium]